MMLLRMCVYWFLLPQPVRCDTVTIDPSINSQLNSGLKESTTVPPLSRVSVEYTLTGDGYHRELIATLWRDDDGVSPSTNEAVDYIMVVNITSTFFIDLDQMAQLTEFGGPSVISSGAINTEQHTMDSKSYIVLVYITLLQSIETRVKVPLHFRYQATGSSPYSVTVVPTPYLLSKTITNKGLSLPCSPATHHTRCHWSPTTSPLTTTTSQKSSPLVAMVPVGQSSHVTLVAIVTVSLTFGSMLYLINIIIHST